MPISRVLSWMVIYLAYGSPHKSSGYAACSSRTTKNEHTSLQQTGFTSSTCHHVLLWALTFPMAYAIGYPSLLGPLLSPLPYSYTVGGIVSVALSLESPLVAVSNCPVLCCPDFPLALLGYVAEAQATIWHTTTIIPHYGDN